MTVTPSTFVGDHSRNANEIFKFNSAINTGIDAAAAAAAAAAIENNDSTSDAPYVIPLKIILPVEHVHKSAANNSYVRYNYILLKVDDIAYHEHIPSDNTEILFPLVDNSGQTENPTSEALTSEPDSDTDNAATTIATVTDKATAAAAATTATSTANVFDIDGNEHTNANANATQNDIVLVDSQGYRYELSHHIKIMDEFETNVVEFDSIAMVRETVDSKSNANHATKRILNDDDEQQQQIDHEKNDISVSKYERHYAKIFQWLHYHL